MTCGSDPPMAQKEPAYKTWFRTIELPELRTQIPGGPGVLVGWAKEKEAIAVDVHKLILKFSDLRVALPRPSD